MTPLLDIGRLHREFPGRRIDHYASIDSTMHAAARCPVGTVVLAEEQTAGQGRHGHSWHSEPHCGIYCSLVLEPTRLLTLALGLATAEAITRATGLACDLRWPNDVMIRERKVAGILVQLVEGKAVAGIGINVNHTAFPEDLATEATSLRIERAGPVSREEILIELLRAVGELAKEDGDTILRLFTHASSYAVGRRVVVRQPDGLIEGVTAGLNASGFLIVRQPGGTDTLIIAGGVRAADSG